MRFRDLKNLTRSPNYRITVGWRYLEENITELIATAGADLNPDFQRGHVWTRQQQINYVEYSLRGGMGGHDIFWNAPGWPNCAEGAVLVDGKQRIQAVRRFITDQNPAFGYVFSQFEDKLPIGHGFTFHINDLETRWEVLRWYLEMNSGGTPHAESELDRVLELMAEEEDNHV